MIDITDDVYINPLAAYIILLVYLSLYRHNFLILCLVNSVFY